MALAHGGVKIYIHTGPGHYIGSCIMVLSRTREAAERAIRAELDKSGLRGEALSVKEKEMHMGIVYANNGN